jgi:hypothetical protein
MRAAKAWRRFGDTTVSASTTTRASTSEASRSNAYSRAYPLPRRSPS